MSYVEKHLMPGEQIEYRANLHWLVFLLPILLFIPAVWLYFVGGDIAKGFALILIVGVLVTGLIAVIERRTSEFAVTNKRVLIKTGLIRRHSLETLLSKIESIGVAQSILGRILGFGTIVISGTGGSKEPFHKIADPMQFRRRVQEQIAAMEEGRGYAKGRISAASRSSARTTKCFSSRRCASAIQIVRSLESISEPQPQLQPALLRLSAMISQYFFRHQGVAPYESGDAPGKEKPTRPSPQRNLKITLRSNADTVSRRKAKRENALKVALPRTPGSRGQTGVPIICRKRESLIRVPEKQSAFHPHAQ